MEILAHFHIVDREDGVVLRPKTGSGASLRMQLAANTLVGVCAMTVKPVEAVRQNLPRHAGKVVSGGIMWQAMEQMPGGRVRQAIIANDTAAVLLDTDQPDSTDFVDVVSAMRIDLTETVP